MNRMLRSLVSSAVCLAAVATVAAAQPPAFAPRFADRMVLQQGAPILVEGSAAPGAAVHVSLGPASTTVTAGTDGHWSAKLDPLAPARNLTLAAATPQGAALRRDIHIGDVFLCSGQSNMAHPVATALNPGTELSGPFPADMRLLKVPQQSSVSPQESLPEGSVWRDPAADTVSGFSAICYFFGRDHAARTGLPVGLIDSSWGGSRIEAWISPEGLTGDPQLTDGLALISLYATEPAAAQARYGKSWEAWWTGAAGGYTPWTVGLAAPKPVPGPLRDWKTFGDPELASHLGLVWFERTFDVDPENANSSGLLSLGGMDEIDSVWVNGKFAGTSFGWGTPRTYFLPEGTLQSGTNRISVSVYNGWGAGGMTGPESAMKLSLGAGNDIALGGNWAYEKVPSAYGAPPSPPWQSISGLAGLHHAMLAPLSGLRFAGALWYQGESNAGEPDRYKDLLDRLAADLRRQFGEALPVLVFQLPEFGARSYEAGNSGWSALRDAQRRFVVEDPASGLVVVLGAGDPWDIHPPNKQEPARRAVPVWQAVNTAAPIRKGYSPESITRKGSTIRITLPQTEVPYLIAGSDAPIGFSLCETDGTCRFATASLSGRVLELRNAPRRTSLVRYCWGDTPVCNLMSPDGVPVTPFELKVP